MKASLGSPSRPAPVVVEFDIFLDVDAAPGTLQLRVFEVLESTNVSRTLPRQILPFALVTPDLITFNSFTTIPDE